MRSHFLRQLRVALLEDFNAELVLACRVAVLTAAGYRGSEIRRQLACAPAEFEAARARVKRVALRLDPLRPDEMGQA
jgi:hypothetical protein